jgi:hypothetical protein
MSWIVFSIAAIFLIDRRWNEYTVAIAVYRGWNDCDAPSVVGNQQSRLRMRVARDAAATISDSDRSVGGWRCDVGFSCLPCVTVGS